MYDTVYDDEDRPVRLPTRWVVCPECRGKGTSTRYLGAFTGDEMAELGPEFADDYARGLYDRECGTCFGRTTVEAVDEDLLTDEQRRLFDAHARAEAELRAEEAAERRAGC
jgi:hypothetical protein